MSFSLISTLIVGTVLAAPLPPPSNAATAAPPADHALRLLSRYGPGELPLTDPVLTALADVAADGGVDAVPLLRSLREHEAPGVAAAAGVALREVEIRHRAEVRQAFVDALPRRDALSGWLDDHPAASEDITGQRLGDHDRQALAYATLVLGAAPEAGPRALELTSPDESAWLLAQAEDLVRAGQLPDAVATLAQATASGNPDAAEALTELDVDVERLLLGMTTAARARPAAVLPPSAIDALLSAHGRVTVAVLIERATHPAPLSRAVALDALAELAERQVMTPRERAAAHRSMVAAAKDPRPAVRALAATALSRSESP